MKNGIIILFTLVGLLFRTHYHKYVSFCLCLALNSSDFLHHGDNNWCATVGVYNNKVSIYENHWTDDRQYICQYNREYRTLYSELIFAPFMLPFVLFLVEICFLRSQSHSLNN